MLCYGDGTAKVIGTVSQQHRHIACSRQYGTGNCWYSQSEYPVDGWNLVSRHAVISACTTRVVSFSSRPPLLNIVLCVVGKRLPLYGVVGATFLLGGYVFFFNSSRIPEDSKTQKLPGAEDKKQGKGQSRLVRLLNILCLHAEYSENQPTRKLMQAAGKKEGDANIFPSKSAL